MNKTRQWVICAALAIAMVMAAGWFLLVSPQRAKAADLRAQAATEQSRSAALRTDLDVLTAQSKLLPAKVAELAKLARQLPSDPALPAMIRALQRAASTSGVALVSIAPLPPVPFTAAGAVAPAPAVGAAGTGLQSITLTTKVTGSYVKLEQFVANLEGLPRMFVVTGYTMSPSTASRAGNPAAACTAKACLIDLEVIGLVFVAPPLTAPPAPPTAK